MQYLPQTMSEQLNNVSIKLVAKQKEVESVKRRYKELETLCTEQKSLINQTEKKLNELEKEKEKKDIMINAIKFENDEIKKKVSAWEEHKCVESCDVSGRVELATKISTLEDVIKDKDTLISELKRENGDLVNSCKSLKNTEAELSHQVKVLQEVCGHVNEGSTNELVVINNKNSKDTGELEAEIQKLRQKIDKVYKSESLLKDQLSEKAASLDKIDNFYKEIIDQKDKALNDLLNITEDNTETGKKMRRLLLKFRSEQELKFISGLKMDLDGKEAEGVVNNDDSSTINNTSGTVESSSSNHEASPTPEVEAVIREEAENTVDEMNHRNMDKKTRLCKFGRKCSVSGCEFSHNQVPRPCRFGGRCTKGDACLFSHEDPARFRTNCQGMGNFSGNRNLPMLNRYGYTPDTRARDSNDTRGNT